MSEKLKLKVDEEIGELLRLRLIRELNYTMDGPLICIVEPNGV